MSEEPKWVTYDQVVAIHSRQLRRFGGAPGLRDDGMLRSALERPVNKWQYEQSDLDAPDLATLAAAYGFGLAKNHAFVDGNKRAAFMTMVVFLRKNDVHFAPDPAHATSMILSLAAGEVSERSLTRWIRDNWPAP
jgi:death-on-curing protein